MDFKIDVTRIEEDFYRIANDLMNHHVIAVKDVQYRIVDCEFYYDHPKHPDKYTYPHKEHEKNGTWFFHDTGVDITFGNKEENAIGGILIRGIAKVIDNKNENGNYIEKHEKNLGPLNTLDILFSHYESVFDKTNAFYLMPNENIENVDIFESPRRGLKNSDDKKDFYKKPYRFISFPYLRHAGKSEIQKYLVEEKKLDENVIKELFTPKYIKAT
jgi:hypothetical protein